MHFTTLAVSAALLVVVSAQELGTYGPFQITSTQGALGNTSYGAEIPKDGSGEPYSEFLITDNGTLFTSAGDRCGFLREYLKGS